MTKQMFFIRSQTGIFIRNTKNQQLYRPMEEYFEKKINYK